MQNFVEQSSQSSDPKADAAKAIDAGDFRLIVAGQYSTGPIGVTCFTPDGRPNGALASFLHGDYITPDVSAKRQYIRDYNIAIVESASYPDRDICRVASKGDPKWNRGIPLVAQAARPATTPPLSLHEAARRGNASDVSRFLASLPAGAIDAVDGTGMTPLAWAVARDNSPAIVELLRHGAQPWAGETPQTRSAVFWAAATGRAELFKQFADGQRPNWFTKWPQPYLAAAVDSGNGTIVQSIVREGYQPITVSAFFRRGLPRPSAVEPLLREKIPGFADEVLFRSVSASGEDQIPNSLVKLALQHGANPNAKRQYGETPLGLASRGYYNGSLEAVELLLKYGAEVNLPSADVPINPKRPIWVAVGTIGIGGSPDDEIRTRSLEIVKRLVAAGADLRLPNKDGRPPIWFLLTPMRGAEKQIDASPNLINLLPTLVKLGLDPNAAWHGQTILSLVVRQFGADAPLAVKLRALGAR
ncbi:ankyrin repeat domain-containing protein [Sphingomonas sp. CA1-15]|uniref:Ankyrin repeat domain-containing protein n=2 Tax=Sphingomonas immobilis TaxID=3063997 RepID=A0ABT9A3D1_9SPHN|nr:ankyrin repeat domain-containing protein [Sphingomonas sp. CA1-15]